MKKIYEDNLGYTILKPYVDSIIHDCYKKAELSGLENIPTDGAVIFAANHCNTLMDALVILRSRKPQTVFGARADLYNNPLIAKFMRFFRILPMARLRDGLRNVLKNRDVMEEIVETLENKVPFCVFPEGRHRTKHSLLSFGKGLQRIAFEANEKFGDKMPIYIVPVGLEYGDYFRTRSTSLVTFAKPIHVQGLLKELEGSTEADIFRAFAAKVAEGISESITYLPDDDKYEYRWALLKALQINNRKLSNEARMKENKACIEKILKAEEANPEQMQKLYDQAFDFERRRRKKEYSIYSFRKTTLWFDVLYKTIFALAALPVVAVLAVLSAPIWITTQIIRSIIKDRAFKNTVNLGVRLALQLITTIIWLCIFLFGFETFPGGGLMQIVMIACAICMGKVTSAVYDYAEFIRLYISDFRLLFNKGIKTKLKTVLKIAKSLGL